MIPVKAPKIQRGRIITAPKSVATEVSDFVTSHDRQPTVETAATVTWDERGLTVSFVCEDREIVALDRPHNDPETWLDDCVELYLDIDHQHRGDGRWIHILVSAANCVHEQENRDRDFHAAGLRTAVQRSATGWTAEIFLPWLDLGVTPAPGDVWGLNLNRSDYPAGELVCFAPTWGQHADFHTWGHLLFTTAANAADDDALARIDAVHDGLAAETEAVRQRLQLDHEPFPGTIPGHKSASLFAPPAVRAAMQRNAARFAWAAAARDRVIETARPWLEMSEDALWELVFGCTLTRSWVVWQHGHCPSCKAPVVMYNWRVDAANHPWKVQCPECSELFPKNDFAAYYRSGLDQRGVFDPQLADRTLLFNSEHPADDDPLRGFGVDDGNGYVDGDKCWRFIGCYLVYGQWKQRIMGGVEALSLAYTLTGEAAYARRTAILLDRIADLYPTFDYSTQALVYGRGGSDGYVTMWHDACEETKSLALAYDRVFDAVRNDPALVAFLTAKAETLGLANRKQDFAAIQRNIETGILIDALNSYPKIHSNYPRSQITQVVLKAILDWPDERESMLAHLERFCNASTSFDGLTGEKGLAGYTVFTIRQLADCLALFARIDDGFTADMLARCPGLRQTWRFHLESHCLGRYYPQIGDAGWFASAWPNYPAAAFQPLNLEQVKARQFPIAQLSRPSVFAFFHQLYRATGDVDYIRLLYRANGNTADGLPHDLQADDPAAFQAEITRLIGKHGTDSDLGCIDKQEWCLAILRAGRQPDARAVWLDYDAGGSHGHMDGMNLGLFAKGLDLMPDFGYPPLQYESKFAHWYKCSVAHNTVVVDREEQRGHFLSHRRDGFRRGRTTLWADTPTCKIVRVDGPELIDGARYERTVGLIDVSAADSYVIDLFRVSGGREHVKFMRSHFGEITTAGLHLAPTTPFNPDLPMRAERGDRSPALPWHVDWQIEDRYGLLSEPCNLHLRYTDLTAAAEAVVCESWVVAGSYNTLAETWIPSVQVRRRSDQGPLTSTFVGIIEPYQDTPLIAAVRRLPLVTPEGNACGDSFAALEITLVDGRRDLLIAADQTISAAVEQPELGLATDAELVWLRLDSEGEVCGLRLLQGTRLSLGSLAVSVPARTACLALQFGPAAAVSARPG